MSQAIATVEKKVEHTRKEAWVMFNRIAHRYDLLNRLLSFRQDIVWRKKLVRFLPDRENLALLDVATGTGDVIFSLLKNSNKIEAAIGIDMAEKMLEVGRSKLRSMKLENRMDLRLGNATDIPFEDNTFDLTTISFGIRNVNNLDLGIQNMYRILKKRGRILVLEFSLPNRKIFKALYLFYFRRVLPFLGGLISGDSYAYNYLNQSVETFPYGNDFCDILMKNGFKNVKFYPLTFGIATIYQGDKE